MKKFPPGLRLLAFLALAWTATATARAQAPAWQSAVSFGVGGGRTPSATNRYAVSATAGNGRGDLYVAGLFLGTVSFGSSSLTSVSQQSGDVFVAKWSGATNAFVYAQRIGQASATAASGSAEIAALAANGPNVYATGRFFGTIRFGTSAATLTNSSNQAVTYITRLTDAGAGFVFPWARTITNTTSATSTDASALAVSGSNVYLAGSFQGSAGFGSTVLTSVGTNSFDAFVTKLDDVGAAPVFAWALRGGGTGDEGLTSLAVRGAAVYAAGLFDGATAVFGPTTLTNAGAAGTTTDVFVAQVTDGGATAAFTAAQRAGGPGIDKPGYGGALAAGPAGVYLAGSYDATPLTFGSTAVPAQASSSILARWNPATGAFDWVQAAPGGSGASPNQLQFTNLATNGTSLYMAGGFSGTVVLGGATLASSSPVTGDYNLWVGKFADTGTGVAAAWAKEAGGSYPEYIRSLALSGTTLYVQGDTGSASLNFAPLTLTNPYFNGSYGSGGFLASLTDPTLTATATATATAAAGEVLRLFPNPAHAAATLRLPATAAPTEIALLDALGRPVRRYPVPAHATEAALDLRGLPAGLYVLRAGAASVRLVVE